MHAWILPPASMQELQAVKCISPLLSKSRLSKLAMTSLSVWAPGWGICLGLVTVGPGASRLLRADSYALIHRSPCMVTGILNQFMGENRWVRSSETNHLFRCSFSCAQCTRLQQAIRSLSLHRLQHGHLAENNGKFYYTLWYFWFHIRNGITTVISPKTY